MTQYRQLTRGELTAFDNEATDMILAAMEAGVLGNVSRKSHAILRNAAGHTMAIARKSNLANRSAQNTRSEYKRFMNGHQEFIEAHAKALAEQPAVLEVTESLPETPGEDAWWCDLCQAYAGQDTKEQHLEEVHPKYTFCNICGALVKKQGLGPHINLAHKVTSEQRKANAKKGAITRRKTMRERQEAWEKAKAKEEAEKQEAEAQEEAEKEPAYATSSESITDEQVAEVLEREQPEVTDQVADVVGVVEKIRDLLGKDPRISELEGKIVELTEERDNAIKAAENLEARLALMREALDA